MNKPHLVDWTNAGIGALALGALAYLNVKTTEIEVTVAQTKGAIEYETELLKDLKEDYEELDGKVDKIDDRLVKVETTLGLGE